MQVAPRTPERNHGTLTISPPQTIKRDKTIDLTDAARNGDNAKAINGGQNDVPGTKRGLDDETTDDEEPDRKTARVSEDESDYGEINTQEINDLTDVVQAQEAPITLDKAQQKVLDLVLCDARPNICVTTAAGCGKTRTLKALQAKFDYIHRAYATIAPTGLTAFQVGGKTMHSFLGWIPGTEKLLVAELPNLVSEWNRNVIESLEVLLIEEISMISRFDLDRLDHVLQSIRGRQESFGAVQIICFGDFHQLPPTCNLKTAYCLCGRQFAELTKGRKKEYFCCSETYSHENIWAFEADAWRRARFKYTRLSTPHRQTDERLLEILFKVRNGNPLLETEIESLKADKDWPEDIIPIKIYPQNKFVDEQNREELAKLPSKLIQYRAYGVATRDSRFAQELNLKVGAKVMLTYNMDVDRGLSNGQQGIVVGIQEGDDMEFARSDDQKAASHGFRRLNGPLRPRVRFINGETKVISAVYESSESGCRAQIPLTLAWSMTIHKSQGLTLEYVELDLRTCFNQGMGYTALSRTRSLDRVRVLGLSSDKKALKPSEAVARFYRSIKWS